MNYENPLIVQGDRSLLLDVHAPLAEECRNALIPFAELEKSPEHLHTYRLTPLSLWNAASAGFSADDAAAVLNQYARYDVPQSVIVWIKETASRFGKIKLIAGPDIEVPVKEGDVVKKGDVLCSIEAMKMMNEVRSNADGKVIKILAENGSLVEYHQTLFVIE